ncbi:hypothetical protein IEQ34_007488 [Dendrobium chrysotoxum]|uniref:Uncharacterized protein n=1 Tax=Dendrobium chrysotoxum TaxID=161865 RepID=A0AAV7H372_DENCH|nr:hypothetical protein IEQ34_007488 [Dendrobium chrysotoxum]
MMYRSFCFTNFDSLDHCTYIVIIMLSNSLTMMLVHCMYSTTKLLNIIVKIVVKGIFCHLVAKAMCL